MRMSCEWHLKRHLVMHAWHHKVASKLGWVLCSPFMQRGGLMLVQVGAVSDLHWLHLIRLAGMDVLSCMSGIMK